MALFLTSRKATTVPVTVPSSSSLQVLWGDVGAGATIELLPMLVVVFLHAAAHHARHHARRGQVAGSMTIALTEPRQAFRGRRTVAVRGVDLEIRRGEFFTLLGPSGCGKTTTLRMIAGLEGSPRAPSSSRGRDVTDVRPGDRDVAMVFQSYALYPHMTVRENLGLNLQVASMPKRRRSRSASTPSRACSGSRTCSTASRASCPAASGSASRSAAPWSAPACLPHGRAALQPRSQAARGDAHRAEEAAPALRMTTVYVTHDQSEALILSDRIGDHERAASCCRSAIRTRSTRGPPTSSSPTSSAARASTS